MHVVKVSTITRTHPCHTDDPSHRRHGDLTQQWIDKGYFLIITVAYYVPFLFFDHFWQERLQCVELADSVDRECSTR